jgi:glucosamine-6-phosphate deaminase
MELITTADAEELAVVAARLFRDRIRAKGDLRMALPAGRSPRRTYETLAALQRDDPVDFSRTHVLCIDDLCPPAPPDGYFWRQISREFLAWAGVPPSRWHPFQVAAPDLEAMCWGYETTIARLGGLDLVLCGLGWNAHLAANEPGSPLDSRTRPVRLWPETVEYIRSDPVQQGFLSERAVTLGLGTILEAREVIVLVSGAAKRPALRRTLEGPVTPEVPASALHRHPRCTILAARAAVP